MVASSERTRRDGDDPVRILLSFAGYGLPFLVVAGATTGGMGYWAGPVAAYVALPLCDEVWHHVGGRRTALAPRRPSLVLRSVPILYLPLQFGLVLWAITVASREPLDLWEWIGLTAGTGASTGAIGITYAHELIHRSSRFERAAGDALLVAVGYLPFAIEHVEGHHVRAATHDDPASAARGMSVYRFLPRAVLGTVRAAWGIERRRLARANRPTWGPHNRMLWSAGISGALVAVVSIGYGATAVALLAGQALFAVCLLEIVNYIQHYGLTRQRDAAGRYEPLQAHHSWDSDHVLSSGLLLGLPRHSDHHLYGRRPYSLLERQTDAPVLPAGYPLMMLVSLVPPLFFAIMHRRLDEATPRGAPRETLPLSVQRGRVAP